MIKIVSWDYWHRLLTNEELSKVSTGDIPPELTPDHSYHEEPEKETRQADIIDASKTKKWW